MDATDYLGLGLGLLILASPVLLIVRDWWCMLNKPGYGIEKISEEHQAAMKKMLEQSPLFPIHLSDYDGSILER